jgi:hypothetical protein
MTDFLVGLLLSIVTLTGAAGLLRGEWERTRCAYLTFEAAHARLTGKPARWESQIQVTTSSSGVSAKGRCGKAREEVEFPWLDGIPQ